MIDIEPYINDTTLKPFFIRYIKANILFTTASKLNAYKYMSPMLIDMDTALNDLTKVLEEKIKKQNIQDVFHQGCLYYLQKIEEGIFD